MFKKILFTLALSLVATQGLSASNRDDVGPGNIMGLLIAAVCQCSCEACTQACEQCGQCLATLARDPHVATGCALCALASCGIAVCSCGGVMVPTYVTVSVTGAPASMVLMYACTGCCVVVCAGCCCCCKNGGREGGARKHRHAVIE